MKLFANTEKKITKDTNLPHLEITEAVLTHGNIANNYYQQHSRILYTFLPNELSGLVISPKFFYF